MSVKMPQMPDNSKDMARNGNMRRVSLKRLSLLKEEEKEEGLSEGRRNGRATRGGEKEEGLNEGRRNGRATRGREKEEGVSEKRNGRARKDTPQDPQGKKDSQKDVKDKEEKKTLNKHNKTPNSQKICEDSPKNNVLRRRREEASVIKQGKGRKNKEEEDEEEDFDFAAIEKKIFEGKEELMTPEKKGSEEMDKRGRRTSARENRTRKEVINKDEVKNMMKLKKEEEKNENKKEARKSDKDDKVKMTRGKLIKEEMGEKMKGRGRERETPIKREKQVKEEEEEEKPIKKMRRETQDKRKMDIERKKREVEEEEEKDQRRGRGKENTNKQAEKQKKTNEKERKKTNKQEEEEEREKTGRKRKPVGKERQEEEKRRKDKGAGGRQGRGGGGRKMISQSDSEMSDWEEVDEMEGVDEVKELLSQTEGGGGGGGEGGGVRIELDAPETLWGMKRRKKRRTEEELIEDYLRRKVNDTIRQVAQNTHKVHLLCLLAHGRHLNAKLGTGTLLGAALSTTPGKNAHPPGRLDLTHLQRLVTWFGKKFPVKNVAFEENYWDLPIDEVLVARFGAGEMRSAREAVLCFVALCRALGISARLVLALQPLSWKPAAGTLIKPGKIEEEDGKVSNSSSSSSSVKPSSSSSSSSPKPSSSSSKPQSSSSSSSGKQKESKPKKTNRKMVSSDSETSPTSTRGRGGGRKRKTDEEEEEEEEDSDFEIKKTKYRNPWRERRKSQEDKKKEEEGRKKKEEEGRKKRKTEMVEWVEVFVEEEEKWVCVDVVRGKIHCVADIEGRLPPGSAYVTAFTPDLCVKDVTLRYISTWLSSEKKLRCSSEWWAETLRPFRTSRTQRDKEEDEEMQKILHLQPLPKTVAEYKNHPLYALQRHLLKFEAIYPPDVSPAGFFKGEPVYPRSSVHNLHSRETWIKEALSVRVDEEPYKTVKARPKWDRVTCQMVKDRPLELFGEWQVEPYEPPVAVDGKVPRNEYGNVELFKPSMMPRGCVHVPVTGINRLARKLNIDCAPAMVGFDFHSGWSHPVYDGYVVCQEHRDTLMDAWNQEQEILAKRAEEKRTKRIYDNWRKLIKGMLVRERVRQDYQIEEEEEEEEEEEKKKKKEEGNKRKIRQTDIDALQKTKKEEEEEEEEKEEEEEEDTHKPRPLITHQVRNLSIDLTSNVAEMAKKSRQKAMKTKNSVRRPAKGRRKAEGGHSKVREVTKSQGDTKAKEDARLSEESEEEDEEEKKEKIRAILNWGCKSHTSDPDLSDDSDAERGQGGNQGRAGDPNPPMTGFLGFPDTQKRRKTGRNAKKTSKNITVDSGSESESSVSISRSTTPEPEVEEVEGVEGPRRVSRRTARKGGVPSYKEEERESDAGNLSEDSDCNDKLYKPV